jgi:hypothetical protein
MATRQTKYASVVKDLPKYLGDDPGRVELLNKVRDEILATPASCMLDNNWNIDVQMLSRLADVKTQVASILALGKQQVGDKRSAAAFASAYAATRTVVDTLGDLKSAAQLLQDAYERLMVEKMEEEGVASLRLESGASVSTYMEPYSKIVDREAFRNWCIDNGYEPQMQLLWMTTNAIAKERTLAGEAPPDGVEVTAKVMVRLNRG